ncbi:MAG: pyrroline-5-carboxylate reductase, partial [Alphaproteobacteria bacterium HGW-Alphaproteobacteria-12]
MTLSLERPLVLVGAGKMGGALLSGWLANGLSPALVCLRDPEPPADVARLAVREGISLNATIRDIALRQPAVVVV